MQEPLTPLLVRGLAVRDRAGGPVGRLVRLYLPLRVGSRPAYRQPVDCDPPDAARSYVEVATGRRAGPSRLFVPVRHISRVADDAVHLDIERAQLRRMGWERRPRGIDDDEPPP